jgi:tyrosyl-tRNA synthetase
MRTGHDFISRMTNYEEDTYGIDFSSHLHLNNYFVFIQIGVTVPLMTNEGGEKLGKSVGNALWLDENLSTPYECYQVSFIIS